MENNDIKNLLQLLFVILLVLFYIIDYIVSTRRKKTRLPEQSPLPSPLPSEPEETTCDYEPAKLEPVQKSHSIQADMEMEIELLTKETNTLLNKTKGIFSLEPFARIIEETLYNPLLYLKEKELKLIKTTLPEEGNLYLLLSIQKKIFDMKLTFNLLSQILENTIEVKRTKDADISIKLAEAFTGLLKSHLMPYFPDIAKVFPTPVLRSKDISALMSPQIILSAVAFYPVFTLDSHFPFNFFLIPHSISRSVVKSRLLSMNIEDFSDTYSTIAADYLCASIWGSCYLYALHEIYGRTLEIYRIESCLRVCQVDIDFLQGELTTRISQDVTTLVDNVLSFKIFSGMPLDSIPPPPNISDSAQVREYSNQIITAPWEIKEPNLLYLLAASTQLAIKYPEKRNIIITNSKQILTGTIKEPEIPEHGKKKEDFPPQKELLIQENLLSAIVLGTLLQKRS